MDEFHVIVVGGGAAGCILAARLSEDSRRRVTLLEAGSDTPPHAVPADIRDCFPVAYSNPDYFWGGLTAVGVQGMGEAPYPQARIMGGGSSVMGMWALRGMPSDYDGWVQAGASGWGWTDVLPAFKRLERDLDYSGPLHGDSGPIPIRRHCKEKWPGYARAILDAAEKAGLPFRADINAEFSDGVFSVPVSNDRDGRVSSATGYLTATVRNRSNLAILSNTVVERILFRGRSVQGVVIRKRNEARVIGGQEVIVAAGAIGSPALLLRSGIGPAQELKALGIQPVHDLIGVGSGLQNHCVLNLATWIRPGARQAPALRTYGLACARVSSGHPQGRPGDLHLQFVAKTSPYAHGDRLGIVGAALYAPLSRGKVWLRSPDPNVMPRIDFHLLNHPADRQRHAKAIGIALTILDSPSVRKIRGKIIAVAPSSLVRRLNQPSPVNRIASAALAAVLDAPDPIRHQALRRSGYMLADQRNLTANSIDELFPLVTPVFHPTGTCRIGSARSPGSVVDPLCRVHGLNGLRVGDASIMPSIPTGNTCLPTMMIAERLAQLVVSS